MLRRAALAVLGLTLALAGAGCGDSRRSPPSTCTNDPRDVERALLAAPGRVSLADGTPLSTCVALATGDADLQNVGAVFSRAADDLALGLPRNGTAALRLGYLIGATRRGAAHVQGVAAELVRRVEQAASVEGMPATVSAALQRGLAAGQRDG